MLRATLRQRCGLSNSRWGWRDDGTLFSVLGQRDSYTSAWGHRLAHMSATIRIDADGHSIVCQPPDTVLRAALRAGMGFPYECNSGGCGSCVFELREGEVENLWEAAPGWSARDRKKGRYLGCQTRPKGDISIFVRESSECRPKIVPRRMEVRLESFRDITHDIREFTFVGGRAEFLPGQYAILTIPGLVGDRCYSMANLPNDRGEWVFQIRKIPGGLATSFLFGTLCVGDVLLLDGPYGLAYLREESPRDIVCVAGGSGLAPIVSIMRGAARAGMLSDRRLYFFYGARTARDVCGQEFVKELDCQESVVYAAAVSNGEEGDGWSGARGFVHQLMRQSLPNPLSSYEYYFAGPPADDNGFAGDAGFGVRCSGASDSLRSFFLRLWGASNAGRLGCLVDIIV